MKIEYEHIKHICNAPKSVFTLNWNDIPKEYQDKIKKMGRLRCDGGGVPGHWCDGLIPCIWYEQEYL